MSAQQSVSLPRQPDERSAVRRLPTRWMWWGGYTVAAVLLFFCYLRISGVESVTSDGASNALQAWDMLLLIFLLLDRAPRRPWVPVAAGVMLVWAEVGDRLVLTIGVLPIVVVCSVRAYRDLVQRREPVKEHWFDLALVAAAIVSVGVSDVIVRIIRHLGGYLVAPLNLTFAPSASWPAHIALAAEGILGLYGADFAHGSVDHATAIALVHLAGLALAVWAVSRAIRRFFTDDDLITQVLVVAILVNLAAYTFSQLPETYWANREIANVLPFGAVLAGRLLADKLIQARLLAILAAIACCYLVALGYGLTRPHPPANDEALAGWLSAHHLTGVAWAATPTATASNWTATAASCSRPRPGTRITSSPAPMRPRHPTSTPGSTTRILSSPRNRTARTFIFGPPRSPGCSGRPRTPTTTASGRS